MRDNFSNATKKLLAERAAYHCSNPDCCKQTIGPAGSKPGSISIGVAAHIYAAAKGGPRYDENQDSRERKSPQNGIWLCRSCGDLIDKDPAAFPPAKLLLWKRIAESRASKELSAGSSFRPIHATELVQQTPEIWRWAILQLEEELGCDVRTDLRVPTTEGWLRLDAAVVRDDALVGIDIHESRNGDIPYFQIDYLLELCARLEFTNHEGVEILIVVLHAGALHELQVIDRRLTRLLDSHEVTATSRTLRVGHLRRKFST
ncbi:MAG: hypothetical protein AAF690_16825 [Acidobacteriota bacterium]